MTIEDYVEQTFPIECQGKDRNGKKALSKPVRVEVKVHRSAGSNMISSEVKCPYNTGAHEQKCIAAYPVDKEGIAKRVKCPYNFDIHYSFQK